MRIIQIKSWTTGEVLFKFKLPYYSMKTALEAAVNDSVDLSYANLRWADLRGARLKGADFFQADLLEASLFGADISEADFTDANLEGVDFRLAITDNTIFKGAKV